MHKFFLALNTFISLFVLVFGCFTGFMFLEVSKEILNNTIDYSSMPNTIVSQKVAVSFNEYLFFGFGFILASIFVASAILYFGRNHNIVNVHIPDSIPRDPDLEVFYPDLAPKKKKDESKKEEKATESPKTEEKLKNTTVFDDKTFDAWEAKKAELLKKQREENN